ncbi:hypothetical protein [Crocinitomix algicola]|uniref:hypothetical protein n=1 Tax=Crocinitomix algicola TaxID=1740263 RepID=UPI00087338ED|nr:hypothetical protein [Crocinitomix algicola]
MNKILLGLSILILASCGSDNSKSTKTENSNETQFQWDFSKQRKFIYSFSQTVNGENKMGKDRPAEKTYMTGIGHLNVRVKENNLADLSLTGIEMQIIIFNEDGTPRDTMTQKAPANVVQDMKPDGSFSDGNADILFDMLFPLPNKDLEKGDSDEIPMKMPFNVNGSRLYSKGQNTLTFKGFKEIEGRNCAVLKGIINVSKLDVPEELKGDYECSSTGNATYYFDLENGYYVGADIQMVMDVMVDSETENEEDFGMFMKMKSDNVFKIRLEKIEE